MVAAAENSAGEMGNSKTDEHDRTAEGCDDGDEYTAGYDNHHSGTADIQTKVGGIAVT